MYPSSCTFLIETLSKYKFIHLPVPRLWSQVVVAGCGLLSMMIGADAAVKKSISELQDIVIERAVKNDKPVYNLSPYQTKLLRARRMEYKESVKKEFLLSLHGSDDKQRVLSTTTPDYDIQVMSGKSKRTYKLPVSLSERELQSLERSWM